MELYGSIAESKYSFGRWFLELPEIWCRDPEYVKTHPCLEEPKTDWDGLSVDNHKFFRMQVDWVEMEGVFDLRANNWKEKLATFVMWYGKGWEYKGGLWKDTSPLDHIMFLGNSHILASIDYTWAVLNHGPDADGKFIELWYYLDADERPDDIYSITELEGKDFINE